MSTARIRNTSAMSASPRCGAGTRGGLACRAPAVHGKLRCRMHGGAPGSGAPWGNRNARKDGAFTQERIAEQRATRELLDEAEKLLMELEGAPQGSAETFAPTTE